MMVGQIKRLCGEKELTVAELERLAQLPENSVYKWDAHAPSVYKVVRVARILGTTVEALCGDRTDFAHGRAVMGKGDRNEKDG